MKIRALKNYRAQIEDRLRAECAELVRSLEEAEAERARLEADEERQAQAFLAHSASGIKPDEASMYVAGIEVLSSVVAKAREREALLRVAVGQKQAELIETSRERRKLEMLDERRERAARSTEARRTQQRLDEIAARRFYTDKGAV
jgi:flagellar export protein FliJ